MKTDEKQLKIEIANYMYGIGIPVCTRGNVYVREAVYLAIQDRKLLHSLTKKLYPCVAKKYNTTSSKVERAIRYVIERSFKEHRTELATNLFPLTDTHKIKPTNGEFLATIVDHIYLDMDELI